MYKTQMTQPDKSRELTPLIESALTKNPNYDLSGQFLKWGPFIWKVAHTIFTPYNERHTDGKPYLFPSVSPDDFFKKSPSDLRTSAVLVGNIANKGAGDLTRDLHILGVFLDSLAKVSERGPSDSAEPDFALRERVRLLFENTEEQNPVKWKSQFDKVSDAYAVRLVMKRPFGFTQAVHLFTDAISNRNMRLSRESVEGSSFRLKDETLDRNAGLSSFGYLINGFDIAIKTPIR